MRRALPIQGLPSSLEGKTLVQVSDIHYGRVDPEYLISTFRKVEALRPDLVVLTGDLIDHRLRVVAEMSTVSRHFPNGRLATLAVLGNHDYGPGWCRPEVAAQVVENGAKFGITVLRNEVHEVEGLRVVGLDDLWGPGFEQRKVRPLLRSAGPILVLAHNPDTVDVPVWDGYEGWVLSGHTHGGQCKLPFFRPPFLPVRNPRYTAGEFDLGGNRRLYINRGIGHLWQVRFNVRPEVTIFELRRG